LTCKFVAFSLATAMVTLLVMTVPSPAHAQNNASLAITANVDSSATLTISDTAGIASTLTFSGAGNETVPASEGVITVTARVSTTQGNTSTLIELSSTDLAGQTTGNTIPAAELAYTHTTDTGGGTWFTTPLSNNWSTLAALTPGSGLYTGDQIYTLTIPPTANDDTYAGTVNYRVVGF
jgi:hypothetical protein